MYVCSSSICSTVPHKTDCRIEEVSIRMYMKERTALFFCRSKETHDARILGDRRKAVPSGTLMAATGSSRRTAAQRQPLGGAVRKLWQKLLWCECVHIRCFGSPRVSAERFEAVVRRAAIHCSRLSLFSHSTSEDWSEQWWLTQQRLHCWRGDDARPRLSRRRIGEGISKRALRRLLL